MACNQKSPTAIDQNVDTSSSHISSELSKMEKSGSTQKKINYKNIAEVTHDTRSNAWVELGDNSASLALYFNLAYKDTLSVSYSAECWLMFPFTIANNKI